MKTQAQVRASFWEAFPQFSKKAVISGRSKSGTLLYRAATQNEYPATVRCAFVDYVESLAKSGEITETLADRVTL